MTNSEQIKHTVYEKAISTMGQNKAGGEGVGMAEEEALQF